MKTQFIGIDDYSKSEIKRIKSLICFLMKFELSNNKFKVIIVVDDGFQLINNYNSNNWRDIKDDRKIRGNNFPNYYEP